MRRGGSRREQIASGDVRVVYGRVALGRDEPVIAVVRREEDARALEAEVLGQYPEARVMWETLPMSQACDTVHILFQTSGEPDALDVANPVGVGAFADRTTAEREREALASDGRDYIVGSFPLGWRRAGWPCAADSLSRRPR
ncbi:hypothetical protein [Arsenicicoccus sp. oral taxon 190]|uniref:hypothetical protein n=1 Tax=Arsenicicoccus sp. oral taxon 190 TaxID=1658671 RepID=UPI000679EB59|nr:hypothetical protein [Arsenicicoccus sp. oral taxon 190]AKT51940.1 hypothetical protein ADJ73_12820 [Arsenicicoccus sp. oral taxon 190]